MMDIEIRYSSDGEREQSGSEEVSEFVMFIGGDWSPAISGNSETVFRAGASYYGELQDRIRLANIAALNVETVICNLGETAKKSGPAAVVDRRFSRHLADSGFDLACLANNHICDMGQLGVRETIANLLSDGLATVGAGECIDSIYRTYTYTYGASAVSVINVSDGIESNEKVNHGYGSADLESWRVAHEIARLRERGDVVIVICHAGSEFLPIPTPRLRRTYKEFASLGAHLVLGHHPHVVQGYEMFSDTPIFYSLGNFGICREFRRRSEEIGYALEVHIAADEIKRVVILPIRNKRDAVEWLSEQESGQFLNFWVDANNLLKHEPSYLSVWDAYLAGYQIFEKVVDIFCASISKRGRAEALFRNLLADNCYREHIIGPPDSGGHSKDSQAILKKWQVYRTRSRLARGLSKLLRSFS